MQRALVDRAKRGDDEAFDALARTVGDRCMAIAHRILRDSDLAEDAVQAALIIAWRELRTLRDPDRFEPWLHRILTHECYAAARRRRRWSAPIRILPADGPRDPGDILTIHDRDELERAFRRLTVEQRAVLVFHHYLGLSLAEVADAPRHPARDGEVAPPPRHDGDASQHRCRFPNHPDLRGATGMTAPRDPDRLIDAFLGAGPTELPERTYDAVRDHIEHTRQRVVIGPWREPNMSNLAKIAIAAVVVLAVGFGASRLLPGTSGSSAARPQRQPVAHRLGDPVGRAAVARRRHPVHASSIDKPFAARLEFTATSDFKLWGDIGEAGKGWFKHLCGPAERAWRVGLESATTPRRTCAATRTWTRHSVRRWMTWPTCSSHSPSPWSTRTRPSPSMGTAGATWTTPPTSATCLKLHPLDGPTVPFERPSTASTIASGSSMSMGTRVVIDAFDFPEASAADRAALREIVESVQISSELT